MTQRTPRIDGNTELIAHIGFPTHAFKSPMIYNPYFAHQGVNAVVVPFACEAAHFDQVLTTIFKLPNMRGALITMPHKVSTVSLMDVVSPTALIAGACNAVKRGPQGELVGDMFDGDGFVRGLMRKDCVLQGARVLVVGTGGVGSAIAASLAKAGVRRIGLFDVNTAASEALAGRLQAHYPDLDVQTGSNDPCDIELLVNATPMGMEEADPLPVDMTRLSATTFVGEVVMKTEMTAFLLAAQARGCRVQVGSDMLFEQIPAYLEFFGLPTATPELLRSLA